MGKLSIEQILKIDDPEINRAIIMPQVPEKARQVFTFLLNNRNLAIYSASGGFQGLDKYKLVSLAKEYNIELTRYNFAIIALEQKMIERANGNK